LTKEWPAAVELTRGSELATILAVPEGLTISHLPIYASLEKVVVAWNQFWESAREPHTGTTGFAPHVRSA